MPVEGGGRLRMRGGPPIRRPCRRWGKSRRGVSEVVATIILLSLTVTLFGVIFAFVTSFPAPPAQNSNQFQASLTSSATAITGVKVLHLAGPAVPGSALVYLKSAVNPLGSDFSSPYSLAAGGIPAGSSWALGQTWAITLATPDPIPDNITVLITSGGTLLFSVILPGQSFVFPPTFVSEAVTPSTPVVGATFNITAVLTGSYLPYSVYVNMGAVPGFTTAPTTAKMTYAQATGEYYVLADAANGSAASGLGSSIKNGTFYAVLNATASTGQTATAVLPITFISALTFSGPTKLTTTNTTLASATPAAPSPTGQQVLVSWTVFLHPSTSSTTPTLWLSYDNATTVAKAVKLYATAMTKNYMVAYGTLVIIANNGAAVTVKGFTSSTATGTIYAAISISPD